MTDVQKKRMIQEFLKRHSLAVIATVNNKGMPEAGVLEFSETDDFEIIFDTFATYRKYRNMQRNAHVAFAIGWDDEITVQYEGVAREVHGRELEECKRVHRTKLPHAQRFERHEEIRYFKVQPRWIRFSDLSVDPWYVFEVHFL